jgi:hypothetical protein
MASKGIPKEIQDQVIEIITAFNRKRFGRPERGYQPRFRGRFLYLDRIGFGRRPSPICRLAYTGKMDGWEFAIYKHSDKGYDPGEWLFDGARKVDGTITGAMEAGLLAYPF